MTNAVVLVAGAVIVLLVWWRFFRIARPAFPPLQIPDDDPLMADARRQAQATLDRFRGLYGSANHKARLKVPFVTTAGVCEYLWAEVRELGAEDAEVLYLTPPVTHTGRLDRIHRHPLSEIVDWQVELPDGFTMRVMFTRGREQWGGLPAELEAEERRYGHEA
jgi:hypothetical protein